VSRLKLDRLSPGGVRLMLAEMVKGGARTVAFPAAAPASPANNGAGSWMT
jgi:hypothetical protein